MENARNICEANTLKPGSCSNAGVWRACRTDSRASWAAFAIYDDGRETTEDGEAIAYPDEQSAKQAALKNCHIGLHACELKWSAEIGCPPPE